MTQGDDTIITQIEEATSPRIIDQDETLDETQLPRLLKLNLRGETIDIERDTLVLLPESIILHLFPNGLELPAASGDDPLARDAPKSPADAQNQNGARTKNDDEALSVDFDPKCFQYIKSIFEASQKASKETATAALLDSPPATPIPGAPMTLAATTATTTTLENRQVIIALREELEYYVLPPRHLVEKSRMHRMKHMAAQHLLGDNKVFEPLLKNIKKENNMAELHLVEMLCEAGFDQDDLWGYRGQEPRRSCIISVSLLHFATAATSDPDQRSALVAQRLMPFWKKPARKCWWDMESVTLDDADIRLWKRRTWTLEFILV
ncbi:hypothetical protein BC940DRAFT_302269 [Gongronella butleri]|nr:hypothetical protein BC940DRAFT_302269 [Gongronella butleri]